MGMTGKQHIRHIKDCMSGVNNAIVVVKCIIYLYEIDDKGAKANKPLVRVYVVVCFVDILVFNKNQEVHIRDVKSVHDDLRDNQLILNLGNCVSFPNNCVSWVYHW